LSKKRAREDEEEEEREAQGKTKGKEKAKGKQEKQGTESVSELARDFQETLSDYVSRLGLDSEFIGDYDYSSVNVLLVTSVPG
jgi:hypothetical protein